MLDLNNGTYEVAFRLEEEGSYNLGVQLHGQHVCGSPFNLCATPPDGTEVSDTSSQHPHINNIHNHAPLNRQASRSTQVKLKLNRKILFKP